MFEKFARIFSRRHKQTTFSDAGFLGALTVNTLHYLPLKLNKNIRLFDDVSKMTDELQIV